MAMMQPRGDGTHFGHSASVSADERARSSFFYSGGPSRSCERGVVREIWAAMFGIRSRGSLSSLRPIVSLSTERLRGSVPVRVTHTPRYFI